MTIRTARPDESWNELGRPGPQRVTRRDAACTKLELMREPLAEGGALHSLPQQGQKARAALILCHGFAQNISAFTMPTRSLVERVWASGLAPFVLELPFDARGSGERMRGEWDGLARYANVVAAQAMERVLCAHREVAWLGHSMGGVIGVCLPARYSQRVSALVAVGSPLLPAVPGGAVANHILFRCARALAGTGVPMPGKAIARKLQRWTEWLDRPGVGARFPLQLWQPRSLQPHEIRHAIREAFDDDTWAALADLIELGLTDGTRAGSLDVDERLRAWRAPTMVVAGDQDRLVPLRSARLLYERLQNAPTTFLEVGAQTTGSSAGHIDVLMGAHAEACVWPRIIDFLHEHLATPRMPPITPQ